MDRVTAMLDRLPPVYRAEGESRLREIVDIVGLHLATYDEDMDRVQRSRWIDHAFDRQDLVALGELFGLTAAPWEPIRLYRSRLKATVAARLSGSVTRRDLDGVLARILDGAREATGAWYVGEVAFVEFPPVTKRAPSLAADRSRIEPFDRRVLRNDGIEPVPLNLVLRGVPNNRTAVPFVANLTNGGVVGYAGVVPAGKELHLLADAEGALHAELDGEDQATLVYTSSAFVAGERFEPVVPDAQPTALVLERGDNDLWFGSLALFDRPGLDAAAFATAGPDLRQGLFAGQERGGVGTDWDASLFHQPPAVSVDAWWTERRPASFRFEVPAGAVLRVAGRRPEPELDRDRLFRLLQETVSLLRAAAVDGTVVARPLRDEHPPVRDRCTVVAPVATTETASAGDDHLEALGAFFDITETDRSRWT